MAILTLCFVLLIGAGALAYRLSLGPLEIPGLATRLAAVLSGPDLVMHARRAALAWNGYRKGGGEPLFLLLEDVSAQDAQGRPLARMPQARLAFSLGGLLSGRADLFVSSRDDQVIGTDAPVSVLAGIRLTPGLRLAGADMWVTLGPGRLGLPGMDEPVAGGRFLLSLKPNDVRLDQAVLTLQPFGRSAPVLRVAAGAHRAGAWQGTVTLSAEAVQAADLRYYWPARFAPLTRDWVVRNITGGEARDLRFTLGFSAPRSLTTARLARAEGGFAARDVTLTWMQGVVPLTRLDGAFTLADKDDIAIAADTARWGGILIRNARMHISGVSQPDQFGALEIPVSGTVQDTLAMLNGPDLRLLATVPPPVASATGEMSGIATLKIPLQGDITPETTQLDVAARLTDVTLPLPLRKLVLREGALTVDASFQRIALRGNARLFGQPTTVSTVIRLSSPADPTVGVHFDMATTATDETLRAIGWDAESYVQGAIPVQVHLVTAGNSGQATVNADLTDAGLSLPLFGWKKPAGAPGRLRIDAGIAGRNFSAIDQIDAIAVQAPGLDVATRAEGRAIALTRIRIGDTEGSGRLTPPAAPGGAWRIALSGSVLDLSAAVSPRPGKGAPPAGQGGEGPPAGQGGEGPPAATAASPEPEKPATAKRLSGILWQGTAHFAKLVLAKRPRPALDDFRFTGNGQGGFIVGADATALANKNMPVTLTVTPGPGKAGDAETVRLRTADAGTLLRAIGVFDELSGGRLDIAATYGAGTPVSGVARMTDFRMLDAPAIGKFLQAVTVLGIPEAASGPGLLFTRMIAPFSYDRQVLTLRQARAYSASLGLTASGALDLADAVYDIDGTVVPAYMLNALLGKIPLIGKLFSPEKGGGLIAMRYTLRGPLSDPTVTVNPFSALTPGFLRGIFGIAERPAVPSPKK